MHGLAPLYLGDQVQEPSSGKEERAAQSGEDNGLNKEGQSLSAKVERHSRYLCIFFFLFSLVKPAPSFTKALPSLLYVIIYVHMSFFF